MKKRFFFFALVNIAMIFMIQLVLRLFGVETYLYAYGLNYQSLAVFCLVWGMVGSFVSLQMSRWMAKRFMGVQVVDATGPYAQLVNTVHRLSRAANLSEMPEVGIYDSPEVNAFATGPSRSRSLVAVSTGLLNNMQSDEVEGVLAHEVAHVANGDMVTMALVQGVVNAFVMFLARVAAFAIQNLMRSDDDESSVGGWSYYITAMLFDVLFGILGAIVVAWFSRMREYRADAGGAKLAGKSQMVNALKRLQTQFEGGGVFDNRDDKIAAFKISNKPTGIRALFSTHPPLSERIARLEKNAY